MIRVEQIGDATLYLCDCRDVLPGLQADALLSDPPYGIGEAAGKNVSRGNLAVARDYGTEAWDDQTADEALQLALTRVRWAIIFGGNFYDLPPSPCWLVWDKLNGDNDFADCELAWTNLPGAVRRLRYLWNGMIRANREERGFHPTQKPIGVMRWCVGKLPDSAGLVIDPFMGSGTTGIACMQLGRSFIGIEISPRYFDIVCRRIEAEARQGRFDFGETQKPAESRSPAL